MCKGLSINPEKEDRVSGLNKRSRQRTSLFVSLLYLLTLMTLVGCGGGGGEGVSSQVVSGVAAVGATLAGEARIKDISAREKRAVIGSDGSFAFDVSDMKGPFVLQATGSANGKKHRLHSFAAGPGTANINPFSDAAVADAAEVDDPAEVFERPHPATLNKINAGLPGAVARILSKFRPLLRKYNAENDDPIRGRYKADHHGLDGLFDNINVTLISGILTITNAKTGAIIFTGKISDIKGGHFTDDDDDLPSPPTLPEAPAGLTATGGDGQVTVAWSAVGNATSYNIYWSIAPGVTTGNGAKIAEVASPYAHTGLSAASTYYYIVSAVNSAGEGVASAEVSATTNVTPSPEPTVPDAPTGVIATGGTSQATISWTAVSGATSYNIYWATSSGITPSNGTQLEGVTSPTVQTGLAEGVTYYYIVTAVNDVGESTPSVQVAATTLTPAPAPTAPVAPTGVTATGGANRVTISWTAVSNATSYNVYWATASGVTTATGTVISGVTSPYAHTGLSAGAAYYYIVTAVNSVGESEASSQVTASTNAPAPTVPAAPTRVTATGGAKQVSISWTAVSGAISYNLYWRTTSGVTTGNSTKITGVTSPYVQTGLADGTAYYYIVTAVNGVGESTPSSQATATTNAPLPTVTAAPTGVTATGGTNQVTINWTAVSGATSYNLYWATVTGVTTATGTKITGATRPYTHTGLLASTAYYYIVTAMNSVGESLPSTQVSATTAAAPRVLCVSCHGTPPATGKHTFHFPSRTNTCVTCHGTGYDPYALAAALPATHMNGAINIASGNPPGWNATNRTCSNSCHGTKGPW